jgi:hypothetical protein
MKSLQLFRQAMGLGAAPSEPAAIARWLAQTVREACTELGLTEAEIRCGGPIVTMFLTPRHPWEAVVVGPDAYQLYPGFLREDGDEIVWPNIWVADNYTLEKLLAELATELQRTASGAEPV